MSNQFRDDGGTLPGPVTPVVPTGFPQTGYWDNRTSLAECGLCNKLFYSIIDFHNHQQIEHPQID